MQFYLNGYRPGDPFIEDPHPSVAERPGSVPEDLDVLIIGCGPAGLVLAAQMANHPDIRTAIIDRKALAPCAISTPATSQAGRRPATPERPHLCVSADEMALGVVWPRASSATC